jgi:hypothetical protein
MRQLFTTLLLVVAFGRTTFASAIPSARGSLFDDLSAANASSSDLFALAPRLHRRADDNLLRIMPLGASFTQGIDQSVLPVNQAGYRKLLRDQLRYWGYPVNMIGSKSNGDFRDRQHEGHPGLEIDGIAQVCKENSVR